jgi:hypothetical protein
VKLTPNHGVKHHIHTGSLPPVFAKFLDPEKLQIAKAEFKRLESAGLVCRQNPLHMVPKKDGLWRPCGNYCRSNLVTTPDKYPLPNMLPFPTVYTVAQFCQKLILSRVITKFLSFWEHILKTAIIMSFGLFEYLYTPFGLSNAAQTSQRMMDRTTDGLDGVFAYMDDS